jgi:hypothetical protein
VAIGNQLSWWRKNIRHVPSLIALVLLVAGCSSEVSEPPPTFAVSGKVYDATGKPLTGGIVQFISPAQPALNMSSLIAADGAYTLTTLHENNNVHGAIAGDCQVLVTLPFAEGEIPRTIVLPQPIRIAAAANAVDVRLPAE